MQQCSVFVYVSCATPFHSLLSTPPIQHTVTGRMYSSRKNPINTKIPNINTPRWHKLRSGTDKRKQQSIVREIVLTISVELPTTWVSSHQIGSSRLIHGVNQFTLTSQQHPSNQPAAGQATPQLLPRIGRPTLKGVPNELIEAKVVCRL